ncbi:hypothetical protein ACIRF8_18905 [Streptomyces sp. NPDC102406]|uniref:hypothetical protein n=1 Tax=Streptomyces sp. NPDC102406 TaxID=3366171 RepID=UPI0038094405
MTDHRLEGAGEDGKPVPRDMPDQQADGDEQVDAPVEQADRGDDVPDTDEAGTGRRGGPGSGTVHPEHPDPDEPTA